MFAERTDVAASALSFAAPLMVETTTTHIADIREVNFDARTISGVVRPYSEVSRLTPYRPASGSCAVHSPTRCAAASSASGS